MGVVHVLLFLIASLLSVARSTPQEPHTVRRGRGLRLGRGADPVFCGSATIGGQRRYLFSDGSSKPAIWGGAEGDPPAPPVPQPPAPDLGGLELALNNAKTEAQREAQADMLKALGFDKREDAVAWVKAKRDEETATLTEVERRERAAEERERAAEERERAATATTLRARVTSALVTAGAPAGHVNDLVPLVQVAADADDAALTAAVEAKKQQFPALFTAAPAPPFPPAPGGLPAGTPPPPAPNPNGVDPARERARRRYNVVTDKAS